MDESMKRRSSTTGLESPSRSTASVQRGTTSIHRSATTTNLEKATRIRLFRNGDRHFAGKNVVLDRRAQDMDHLLDLLSTKITHQSCMPLQRLYTPQGGHRVTSISDVKHGGAYVIAGKEGFKKIQYTGIVTTREKELAFRRRRFDELEKLARSPRKISKKKKKDVMGRINEAVIASKPKVVYFIRNGDERNECVQMLLTHRNAGSLDQLCRRVSEKLEMEAPCRAIYNVSGMPIEAVFEFDNFGTYIAVSRIAFKQVGYKAAAQPKRMGRKGALPSIKTTRSVAPGSNRHDPGQAPSRNLGVPTAPSALPGLLGSSSSGEQNPDADASSERPNSAWSTISADDDHAAQRHRKSALIMIDTDVDVRTGNEADGGTEADIFITLHGSTGETSQIRIKNLEELDQGGIKQLSERFADIGTLEKMTLEIDAKPGIDPWFVESATVKQMDPSGLVTVKHFWFGSDMIGIWLGNEDGQLAATAIAVDADNTVGAKEEILLMRKVALLGFNPNEVNGGLEDYPSLTARVEQLCRDGRALKRMWKKLDPERLGFTQSRLMWNIIRDVYPPLHVPPILELVYKHVYRAKTVTDALNPVKQGFKAYLLSLAYSCEFYEAVDFTEDIDGYRISLDDLNRLIERLRLRERFDEQAAETEFFKLRHGDGCAHLPETIRWYVELRCPADLSVAMSKREKKARHQSKRKSVNVSREPTGAERKTSEGDEMLTTLASTLNSEADPTSPKASFSLRVAEDDVATEIGIKTSAVSPEEIAASMVVSGAFAAAFASLVPTATGPGGVSKSSSAEKTPPSLTLDASGRSESLAQVHGRIKELEADPLELTKLWRKPCSDPSEVACSVRAMLGLLQMDFPELIKNPKAFNRAYFLLCHGEEPDDALDPNADVDAEKRVHQRDFFSLVIHTLYFNILFPMVDGMEADPETRLELHHFQTLLEDLGEAEMAMVAAGEFDAMDSNLDGLVLADEVCSWYAQTQFHLGIRMQASQASPSKPFLGQTRLEERLAALSRILTDTSILAEKWMQLGAKAARTTRNMASMASSVTAQVIYDWIQKDFEVLADRDVLQRALHMVMPPRERTSRSEAGSATSRIGSGDFDHIDVLVGNFFKLLTAFFQLTKAIAMCGKDVFTRITLAEFSHMMAALEIRDPDDLGAVDRFKALSAGSSANGIIATEDFYEWYVELELASSIIENAKSSFESEVSQRTTGTQNVHGQGRLDSLRLDSDGFLASVHDPACLVTIWEKIERSDPLGPNPLVRDFVQMLKREFPQVYSKRTPQAAWAASAKLSGTSVAEKEHVTPQQFASLMHKVYYYTSVHFARSAPDAEDEVSEQDFRNIAAKLELSIPASELSEIFAKLVQIRPKDGGDRVVSPARSTSRPTTIQVVKDVEVMRWYVDRVARDATQQVDLEAITAQFLKLVRHRGGDGSPRVAAKG